MGATTTNEPQPLPDEPSTPRPVVLRIGQSAESVLAVLEATGQAMAFVDSPRGLVGVVTAEDLRFARDWAGPEALVVDAMTLGIVQVGCRSNQLDATAAFTDALRTWTRSVSGT